MIHIIVGLLTLLLINSVLANNLSYNDVDYVRQDEYANTYIYPNTKDGKQLIKDLIPYHKKLNELYAKSYFWKLDEREHLVWASKNNQVTNAFATMIPYPLITLYQGGGLDLDTFATKSWPLTLLIHETAHLYQMNPKVELSWFTHKVFGNNPYVLPLPLWPIFTFPNFFLPTFIVEGNAVMNESRFGIGGRLYSGEQRAMFYALMKDNYIDEVRVINNHNNFPYGREKYIVGGYFNAYLVSLYGVDKVNSFFLTNANRYLWPFRLNYTFIQHYKKSYYELLYGFLTKYNTKAKQQESAKGKVVGKVVMSAPFNRIGNEVVFVGNQDGKSFSELHRVNVYTGAMTSSETTLPLGKIFKVNNEFYSATNGKIDGDRILYTLWGKGLKRLKKFDGKIVLAKNNKQYLTYEGKERLTGTDLYYKGKFYDTVQSQAIFGKNGDIYYFKQNGKKRALYRNKKMIMSYKGFYGKVVDVDKTGGVYFVASVEHGSSLFRFKNSVIQRINRSDVIVDAKLMENNQILINEIGSQGYTYKIIKLSKKVIKKDYPDLYEYAFEKDPMSDALSKVMSQKRTPKKLQNKPYNAFRSLRYSGWDAFFMKGKDGSYTNLNGRFIDPLMYNSLTINAYRDMPDGEDSAKLKYWNLKHKLNWSLKTEYRKKYPRNSNNIIKEDDTFVLGTGIKYKILECGFWKSNIVLNLDYLLDEKYYNKNYARERDTHLEDYQAINLTRTRNFPLQFAPYRYLSFELEREGDSYGSQFSLNSDYVLGLKNEHFLSFSGTLARTNRGELDLGDRIAEFKTPDFVPYKDIPLRSNETIVGGRAGLEYKKVINWSKYFSVFPISLRRFAPRIFSNYYSYSASKETTSKRLKRMDDKHDFQDVGIGGDFEFLLGHLAPVNVSVSYLKQFGGKKDDAFVVSIGL